MSDDVEFQPLTGDTGTISAQTAQIQNIAAAIGHAVTILRKVQNLEGMAGEAVTKLAGKAGEVADDISKAKDRYETAGIALAAYESKLSSAQSKAQTAITHIEELSPQLTAATSTVQQANLKLLEQAGQPNTDQNQDDLKTAQQKAQALQEQLQPWQQMWRDAAGDKKTAADAAAGKIGEFTSDNADGLNNHWYDGITSFASKAWHAVTDFLKSDLFGKILAVIDDLVTVLSVIAVVIAFIPGVDVADLGLGPIIATLAAISSVGHVLRDGAEGDWKMAIFDGAIGVLSIFGGGAMKAIAKAGVEDGGHVVEAAAESGELKSGLHDVLDEGEGAVSRLSKVKDALTRTKEFVGNATNRVKDVSGKAWEVGKDVGKDGWEDLERGKYNFVSVSKLKSVPEALGYGKEVMSALGDVDHVGRAVHISLLSSASLAARSVELVKGSVETVTENVEAWGGGGEEGGGGD